MTKRGFSRRTLFGVALVLPLGACSKSDLNSPFGYKPFTLSERGDRMVRWLHNQGHDVMMAPEAFAVMGLYRDGRDIPVKQMAMDGRDGRYVISLVNIRKIHEFVMHRRQGDVLTFHHCDTAFRRESSVRYPRNGKPTLILDAAVAESDFRQQTAFWFAEMPGR
ncbi:MAG: hypothetical protein JSR91_01165 [Proteobacteria bacterium]|nr:hypothetical protein [Pseudomonadota bacterium]